MWKKHNDVSLVQGVQTNSRKKWGKESVVKKKVERKLENLNSEKKWMEKKFDKWKEMKGKRVRGEEIYFRKEFEQKVEEK